jgi:hypothetical protein
MRKISVPKPSGKSGANNPRHVFSTVPLEIDLARSSDRFYCSQLEEPDLIFGGGHCCADPRTGLAAYGPCGVTGREEPAQIRVGIVGTSEGIDRTLKLLEEISQPIEQGANVDCVLHPSFPGLNVLGPIQVDLVTQSQWHRQLPQDKTDFRSLKECDDFSTRCRLLQEVIGEEVRVISELENPPQVILCAVSESMARLLGTDTAIDDANFASNENVLSGSGERKSHALLREFRGGLKAECMGSLPTEIIWDQAYSRAETTQDQATRAWNLSLALLHKVGLVPWRLENASEEACFVGISFHRASSHTLKSFAHVFTELGDGYIVDGDAFEWDQRREGEIVPHLEEVQARLLMSRALSVFEGETGVSPRRVAVHKRTCYSSAERKGFENALQNIPEYGLMTVTRRGVFCIRPGRKPILRGTAIPFDGNLGLVFTSGYVPFLRGYFAGRMPQPLEILENWGSICFQQASRDLMRLTRLNLNSSDFCADLPVTLARCKEIGEVLWALGNKEPSIDDKYYV